MIKSQFNAQMKKLLHEIILKHNSSLLPLIDILGVKALTMEQREELREIVAAELCETGLNKNDEPTLRGTELEKLIDDLGHL